MSEVDDRPTPPDPLPEVREKTFGDLCSSVDDAIASTKLCTDEIIALRAEHRATYAFVRAAVQPISRPGYVNFAIAAIPIAILALAFVLARVAEAMP